MKRIWTVALSVAMALCWLEGAAWGDPAPSAKVTSSTQQPDSGAAPQSVVTLIAPPADATIAFPAAADCAGEIGLQVGGGLHALSPFISNNAGLIVSTPPGVFPAPSSTGNRVENFDYDFTLSPSVWVGYTIDSGLGVRMTWFEFNQFANPVQGTENTTAAGVASTIVSASGFLSATNGTTKTGIPLTNGQTNVYNLTSDLILNVWDTDVTQTFQVGRFDVTAGAGFRYLHMSQSYDGSRIHTDLPAGTVDNQFEASSNNLDSWGPTLLLETRRPIGCHGFSLYANARAGLLFGDRHETLFRQIVSSVGGASGQTNTTDESLESVGMAELEIGVSWAHAYHRIAPFARLGLEGREYFGTGNSQSIDTAGGSSSNIGLFGFAFYTGVSF